MGVIRTIKEKITGLKNFYAFFPHIYRLRKIHLTQPVYSTPTLLVKIAPIKKSFNSNIKKYIKYAIIQLINEIMRFNYSLIIE